MTLVVWQRLFGGRSASESVAPAVVPEVLRVLALRDTVTFPGAVVTLALDDPDELALVEEVCGGGRLVLISTGDSKVGTLARIVQVESTPRGHSILVHGIERREITPVVPNGVLTRAHATTGSEFKDRAEVTARLRALAMNVGRRLPEFREKAEQTIASTDVAEHLTDFVVANLDIPVDARQRILATTDLQARMEAVCVCLGELLQQLPAPSGPAAAECPVHGALAKASCGRCGKLACATCLGVDEAEPLCLACRKIVKPPLKVRPAVVDGWHVQEWEWFTLARGHLPPRPGAWALQLGTDLRSRKIQVALASAIFSVAVGLATQQFIFTGAGLGLLSVYLFMLVSVVSGLRDSALRCTRIRVLAPHPTHNAMRIAIGRASDGQDVSVVLRLEPAQTLLGQHRELDVLFLHQPRSQYQHVLAIRPTGPELPADQPARTGWRRRSLADLVVSAVALGLFALVFFGGRTPRVTHSIPTAAPVVVEAWVPIVKELQRRGVSPPLTVLTLTCWELELSSGEFVGGRFQHAVATTAAALGLRTTDLAVEVVGRLATEPLAEAASREALALRPKLDGLPGVKRPGEFTIDAPMVLVRVARSYATTKLIPLPRLERPSPEWGELLAHLKSHDAVALVLVSQSVQVTLDSGVTIDPLSEEAALETVAAATAMDITALRAENRNRIFAEALQSQTGVIPTLIRADEVRALLAALPGVAKAERYHRPPPPPKVTAFKPGDPILAAPWKEFGEPPDSMRWRMGPGEDLMHTWKPFWRGLPADEKQRYLSEHPPPAAWVEWMSAVFGSAREEPP